MKVKIDDDLTIDVADISLFIKNKYNSGYLCTLKNHPKTFGFPNDQAHKIQMALEQYIANQNSTS